MQAHKVLSTHGLRIRSSFRLSGYVNSQNSRHLSAESPFVMNQNPLHSDRIGVWWTYPPRRFLDRFPFNSKVCGQIFVEYKATSRMVVHLATHSVFDGTHNFFEDGIISKDMWSIRSSDQSSPDFCLWNFHYRSSKNTCSSSKRDELRNQY